MIMLHNYQNLSISSRTLKSKVNKLEEDTADWLVKQVIELDEESEYKYTYQKINKVEL